MPRHVNYPRHRPRHGLRYDRHEPVQRATSAGAQQYSANGSTGWAAAIPGTALKVNTDVDYYIRINPTTVLPADNGSYKYTFRLVGSADGDGGQTAGIGGLNFSWVGNLAHLTGKVPADQVGKIFTIQATVTDLSGNAVSATPLSATWVA